MTQVVRTLLLSVAFLAAPAAGAQGQRFVVAESTTPAPAGDVLEAAAATGEFDIFLEAVERAGYAETLRGEGPFTIFAPTDAAFQAMSDRERARLMRPENRDELVALLAYHVVTTRVTSETLAGRVVEQESANGFTLTIDGRDGLRVNDELVAVPDVEAANGVVQGVNSVLRPTSNLLASNSEQGR